MLADVPKVAVVTGAEKDETETLVPRTVQLSHFPANVTPLSAKPF